MELTPRPQPQTPLLNQMAHWDNFLTTVGTNSNSLLWFTRGPLGHKGMGVERGQQRLPGGGDHKLSERDQALIKC